MHAFHERLARVGLVAVAEYGFALAGGYAVQAHGLVSRPSEDVDLFTTMDAEATFPAAVAAAVAAYRQDGLSVEVVVDSPGFARLSVADPDEHVSAKVELGIDWRMHSLTTLAIGPVLDQDDAVANKVNALYSRRGGDDGRAAVHEDGDPVARSTKSGALARDPAPSRRGSGLVLATVAERLVGPPGALAWPPSPPWASAARSRGHCRSEILMPGSSR